jgi:hypothetical protein
MKSTSARAVIPMPVETIQTEPWSMLDAHFRQHAALVRRFECADAKLVLLMWRTNSNESGDPLSAFEREALQERHCELFGTWPASPPTYGCTS